MKNLKYFDCNTIIGPRPHKHPKERWSTEHLLEDMELAEIAGALVTHSSAIHYESMYGNLRLLKEIKEYPNKLFGSWCIDPIGDPGFFTTAEDMINSMNENKIRAVRLVPGSYSLHQDLMGETLDTLENNKILTLMEVGSIRNMQAWGAIDVFSFFHEFLNRYKSLPVLFTNHYWFQQQHIHKLMSLHENLHLEFSDYQINRGIEKYVEDFGDQRLLFGSGMTYRSPGAGRAYIDYAQISDKSKEQIANKNLSRLLKGLEPININPNELRDDKIIELAREGIPISSHVIDAHSHILHEGGQSGSPLGPIMLDGDAKGVIELNRWCGIDQIAMMTWNGPVCTDAIDGNKIVSRAMLNFKEEVFGVAVIDPTHMSEEEISSEIELRYLKQGFIGMKPYVQMDLSYEDPAFDQWWEFGNKYHLYALMHTLESPHTGGLDAIKRLSNRYPNVSWLIAHSAASYKYIDEVAECINSTKNVFAEITYTDVPNRSIKYLKNLIGDEKIIFGTDQPMRDPRQQLGWVIWEDLSIESREKILGKNFQKIISKVQLPKNNHI
tara:strand:- start:5131 stop:6786 length:1656 start_codon:yes stop_codon:yes gene_type:complete